MVSKHFGRGQGGVTKGQSSIDKARQDQKNRDDAKAAREQQARNRAKGHSQSGKGVEHHGRES